MRALTGGERRGENKNKVLLMEIVVVLFFFSISAVTTLQLFARASGIARQSSLNARALIRCEDWAERLMAADDPSQALSEAEGWTNIERTPVGFSAELPPTAQMEIAEDEEATYYIRAAGACTEQEGGLLWEMRVSAQEAQGEVRIELPVVRYDAREGERR